MSNLENYETAYSAYNKALNGINVKENEKIVLECKTFWSYDFALKIPETDIKNHEQIILELKNPLFCFYFAKDIPGANIEEHFKAVLNSENKYWLDLFIKLINYKGTKIEEWLLYI